MVSKAETVGLRGSSAELHIKLVIATTLAQVCERDDELQIARVGSRCGGCVHIAKSQEPRRQGRVTAPPLSSRL